jgi:hypothetical protein
MATKLDAALERIDVAVDRIRTKVSKPTESIEDVATAVEALGTGGSSGIYLVETIEERDNIQANEGDVCVVTNSIISDITEESQIYSVTLKDTVVFDSAVEDYVSLMFSDASRSNSLNVDIMQEQMYVSASSNGTHKSYIYTSEDYITYTCEDVIENPIEFTEPVVFNSKYGVFDSRITKIMTTEDFSFDGIFKYVEGNWEYHRVGAVASPEDIFKPAKAYTNNGLVVGAQDKNAWRSNRYFIQTEEPEPTYGYLWIQPRDLSEEQIQKYLSKDIAINQVDVPFDYSAILTSVGNKSYYSEFNSVYERNNCRLFAADSSNNSARININGTVVNGRGIERDGMFYIVNTLTTSGSFYRVNLKTGASTTLSKPSFVSTRILGVDSNDTYIVYAMQQTASPYNMYLYTYNISSNSWTSKTISSFTNSGYSSYNTILLGNTNKLWVTNGYKNWVIDITTGSVLLNFNLTDDSTGLDLYYINIDALYQMSFSITNNILTTYDGFFVLDLNNITEASITNALKGYKHMANGRGGKTVHGVKIADDLYLTNGTSISSTGLYFYSSTANLFIAKVTKPSTNTFRFVYSEPGVLYFSESSTSNLYSLNIADLKFTNSGSFLVHTAADGEPIQIVEGVLLRIKNIFLKSDSSSITHTCAAKLYTTQWNETTGKFEWVLFKDNTI